ncbi:MAG: hypothetical protein WCL10_08150 [Novosphingobium sp.]|uniref:hypothetical protein n=1 Tax=Novosphingobium sp. TaxID=1874826 RepID=UPI003018B7F3
MIFAVLQGLVGGLVFWFLGIAGALLWGVPVDISSLFLVIGTGLIWLPVTIYLAAMGGIWRAAGRDSL